MAAHPPSSPSTATMDPSTNTYLTTKHSSAYKAAKTHLSSGDLDTCLSLVEAQLVELKGLIGASSSNEAANQDDDDADLHEALCPLHYLYGTTLLYLVEENESMMNGQQQQVRFC